MAERERLTTDQLLELERLLTEQKAPIVARFRPPASADEIAAVESFFGRQLPTELKLWWGWHNGTDVKPHERAAKASIGPLFDFLNSAEALKATQDSRAIAEETDPDDPETWWGRTWLAIGSSGAVACDVDVRPDAPVPVLDVDYHKTSSPGDVVAESLGQMVGWWIEAIDSGAWRYDDEHDRWERRFELVPPERDVTGLV
jgi:cell wall assembly regulator SMI1